MARFYKLNPFVRICLLSHFIVIAIGSPLVCKKPLGVQNDKIIKNEQLTADSYKQYMYISKMGSSYSTEPRYGRLNNNLAWCGFRPSKRRPISYFQIDFRQLVYVTGLATQGFVNISPYYVKTYKLSFSSDGKTWSDPTNNKVWGGNSNGYSIRRNDFGQEIQTRYLRILPQTATYRFRCLRVEVYGCTSQDKKAATSTLPSKLVATSTVPTSSIVVATSTVPTSSKLVATSTVPTSSNLVATSTVPTPSKLVAMSTVPMSSMVVATSAFSTSRTREEAALSSMDINPSSAYTQSIFSNADVEYSSSSSLSANDVRAILVVGIVAFLLIVIVILLFLLLRRKKVHSVNLFNNRNLEMHSSQPSKKLLMGSSESMSPCV
ncbi:discoidin, CUB and LCCL domain-containing protein 2-like isoform X2 [Dendronephthya gigantea]|uniref:discoidin, CUB and LCCL domain-containing protein 2-like isoform X2 n=1 Tax=Dendronephthya gigantea TaxID=151771 RepID=UPI00106BD3C7|nr:discoidin, CUB and LCCL domain-containing protein 2-like isoform X2 [Dendronephthya gigantea]